MRPFFVLRRPSLLVGLLCALLSVCSAQAREVVDVTGRTVSVPDRVARILLGEGRLFYALAMLEGDKALSRVAGWQGDLRTLDTQGYAAFAQVFPGMDRIPVVGGTTPDTFSVEQALACAVVGAPDTVAQGLADLITRTGADELMITAQIYDHPARLRSFALAMQAREQLASGC